MLSWPELKNKKDIIQRIDWDLTPQEAFETYQIKSSKGWRCGRLSEVYYWVIYVYQGQSKVVLVKRSLKHSEEIAEAPTPPELITACLAEQAGDPVPHGQYALDDSLKEWIRGEFQS